jgi:hypothetical protein
MGFYMQAETEEQARNALGVEMMEVVFDEAPTFKWEHMIMIASSVRVPRDAGLTPLKRFNGNPIGPCIDDLWKYFIDQDVDPLEDPEYRPDEWRAIRSTHQGQHQARCRRVSQAAWRRSPEHIRKAWLDGEKFDFGQLFEVVKNKNGKPYHIIDEMPHRQRRAADLASTTRNRVGDAAVGAVFRAYDHGYWPDPAVCACGSRWSGRQVICFKEMVKYRTIAADMAKRSQRSRAA